MAIQIGDKITASDINTALNGKANTDHTHDNRYYTESEVDTKLNGKSNTDHTHNTLNATYSGSGGQQNPSYFGKNKLGSIMSNETVNGHSAYKNWIYVDPYGSNDVGGATAIGVCRTDNRVFVMSSNADRTTWNRKNELVKVGDNVGYATSAGSAGYATSAGSAPASDVYSWAKQSLPKIKLAEIKGTLISVILTVSRVHVSNSSPHHYLIDSLVSNHNATILGGMIFHYDGNTTKASILVLLD
jgi:hypothetical protein